MALVGVRVWHFRQASWWGRHGIDAARRAEEQYAMTGTFPVTDVSVVHGWKAQLGDGSWFRLYFESTNGRPTTRSWMIAIVRTSDGEMYELVEDFDYLKGMALATNPQVELYLYQDVPRRPDEPPSSNIWIRNGVQDLDQLKQTLSYLGFTCRRGAAGRDTAAEQ